MNIRNYGCTKSDLSVSSVELPTAIERAKLSATEVFDKLLGDSDKEALARIHRIINDPLHVIRRGENTHNIFEWKPMEREKYIKSVQEYDELRNQFLSDKTNSSIHKALVDVIS
eukprot:633796_1